jgi:imidazolonepropionase-like amidohydrolase
MKYFYVLFFAAFFLPGNGILAQTGPVVGLRDNTPSVYALENARIVTGPGNVINNGTLIIRDGIIESAGTGIRPPADAWLIDMKGKSIYPGFIDMWSEMAFPDHETPGGAIHWNPLVRSWFDVASEYRPDEEKIKKLRSQGFVLANAVPPSGIFRGKTALVNLGGGNKNMIVIKSSVAQSVSFDRARGQGGAYPTSLMGTISLIRQAFHDVDWYSRAHSAYLADPAGLDRPEMNFALESLLDAGTGRQPVFFDTSDEIDLIRALSIASEFELNLWVKGSGYEYRRLQVIKDAGIPVIIPLDFPEVPDIENPEKAMGISLEALRHWDFAPENPGRLQFAGVRMALTASGSVNKTPFIDQLRIAVERGLEQDAALAALTVTPAELLGVEKQYGTIEKGKVASFIVTNGNLFSKSTRIEEVWIDGVKFETEKPEKEGIRGKWKIASADMGGLIIEIDGNGSRLKGTVRKEDKRTALRSVKFDNHRVNLVFQGDSLGLKGIIRLSASFSNDELYGIGETADGRFMNWKADRLEPAGARTDNQTMKRSEMSEGRMLYPSMEYGLETKPVMPEHLIIRNATIWTQGPSGKIENADMLVSNGRIVQVGNDISAPRRAVVIDAGGRHVTPGLVDPHLHSSIKGGVNEVGNNMTPETRVGDVLEPDNIWVYRLLAGGMTTANLLHGSANPVGGQDAVVKMRWGCLPREMILQDAMPGLKLALGENVVRNPGQYPNTRMGAEQIIRDAFQAAKDYMEEWREWETGKKSIPPRKDLQMDALAEVLRGERIIHAHAYRQDEMQMLIRLAEDMGFRIASFEHAVEGYKIADILRDHGAGAIIWTDWSSFKVEAADGILYNAKTLLEMGVLTSLHSDDTQLSTRMNWEAGKMLATGINEIEAMDLITINPAKLLGADKMVGSLEPGKHADFVIWSGHPLSGFTHAEQTWVDGRKYFDRQVDIETREQVRKERAALIQKAAAASEPSPRRDDAGEAASRTGH